MESYSRPRTIDVRLGKAIDMEFPVAWQLTQIVVHDIVIVIVFIIIVTFVRSSVRFSASVNRLRPVATGEFLNPATATRK